MAKRETSHMEAAGGRWHVGRKTKSHVGVTLLMLAAVFISSGGVSLHRTQAAQADRSMVLKRVPGIVPADLAVEPDDGYRALVRALNKAAHRIFVEIYILTDKRIVRALQRASAQGVEVDVMLEHHPIGMGTQPDRMVDELRASGIAVRWTPAAFALTHAKFLVIDDTLAIISTANLSRSAFMKNREFLVFVRQVPEVHLISQLFRSDWDRLRDTAFDPSLVISPVNARSQIRQLVLSARKEIDLYAEEIADMAMQRLLTDAVRRHIRVQVVLARGQTPAAAALLRRGGADVRQLSQPYIHAKVIIVDHVRAFVGSENLSTQSLDRNREVGVLVLGPSVERMEAVFGTDWRRSRESGS